MQMIATGAVASLAEARGDDRSLVPGRAVRAARRRSVGRAISAISTIRGVHLCLRRRRRQPCIYATCGTRPRQRGWRRIRSSCCAIDRTCSAPTSASPTSAAATPARSSTLPDPLTGEPARVLAVKGSGGDLRSIGASGLRPAVSRQARAADRALPRRSARRRDGRASIPLCAFGENRVAASIDTPLHAFLPFDHVDHLHPDWAIALAASANGRTKLDEFNARYGRHLVWVPWQRPGFELALMLRAAVEANPGCDGIASRRATGCSPGATPSTMLS